eukprot:4802353-Alexandrium_andersonii.AAC.1
MAPRPPLQGGSRRVPACSASRPTTPRTPYEPHWRRADAVYSQLLALDANPPARRMPARARAR